MDKKFKIGDVIFWKYTNSYTGENRILIGEIRDIWEDTLWVFRKHKGNKTCLVNPKNVLLILDSSLITIKSIKT